MNTINGKTRFIILKMYQLICRTEIASNKGCSVDLVNTVERLYICRVRTVNIQGAAKKSNPLSYFANFLATA